MVCLLFYCCLCFSCIFEKIAAFVILAFYGSYRHLVHRHKGSVYSGQSFGGFVFFKNVILLKCKCYNGSNTCGYSQAALADELNLSPSTVSRRINEGIKKGYIKKDKKGIHLLKDDIFKITNETEIGFWKCVYPSIITDEDIANGRIMP